MRRGTRVLLLLFVSWSCYTVQYYHSANLRPQLSSPLCIAPHRIINELFVSCDLFSGARVRVARRGAARRAWRLRGARALFFSLLFSFFLFIERAPLTIVQLKVRAL